MGRSWFQGGELRGGLRALKQWGYAKKRQRPDVDRRNRWVIPLIHLEEAVSQQVLGDRAERLRGAADEAARLVHNSYISFLLLGTYIAIIIGSTTDVQLLKSSPVTLPLLNVSLPIVGFYVFVPWLLLLVYFNLLLHLTLLAQKLHRLNAVLAAFTDAVAREDQRARLFPFPFSAMLIGRSARWSLRGLLALMVWTTVVLLPLGLLLWAQLRFLPYHSTAITWSHRAAVLVDLLLLWLFWPLMLSPAPGVAPSTAWTRRLCWGTGLLGVTLGTVGFALGIAVLPGEGIEGWIARHVPQGWRYTDPGCARHTDPACANPGIFTLTAWLFETPGAHFHRYLQLRWQVLVAGEPSAKVIVALHSHDENKRVQNLEEITGLPLTNRDLRGADLRDTLFAKADLRGANLNGAKLDGARVFAGDLSGFPLSNGGRCVDDTQKGEDPRGKFCRTTLQGATLRGAQLQGASLWGAELQGADLRDARLQGATLRGAQLQGADLQRAQLQGADLWGAQLQGADLWGAQLQGADLQRAKLQGAILQRAQLQGADLRNARLQGAILQRAELRGADLRDARLQGATLRGAQLQGADLQRAELQGTDLWGAELQGADLQRAQLQGANLRRAWIGSADFTEADLAWSDLRDLSLSLLDEQIYEKMEEELTHAIHDEHDRAVVLKRLKAAVGRPTRLPLIHSPDQGLLCEDIFRSCLRQEQIAEYADARAAFLGELGCKSAEIARGIVIWHRWITGVEKEDPIPKTFAKHITAIPEKDCPGWAAVPEDQKDTLRKLAAGEVSRP